MNQQAAANDTDELADKIFAYVEREAGRDAPLSPEDELMLRNLLQIDTAAQAIANDFRTMNSALDDLLDTSNIEVPDKLVSLVRTHGNIEEESSADQKANGQVMAFPKGPEKTTRTYFPLAAAASIATLIASGGLLYQYDFNDREKRQFQVELTNADTTLTAYNRKLEQAQVKEHGFRQRLASLEAENNRLEQQIAEKSQQIAEVENARQQIFAGLDDIGSGRAYNTNPVERDQRQFERHMGELSGALALSEQELADSRTALAVAKRQAVDHERERVKIIQQSQQHLAELEERLNTAGKQTADLTTERDDLSAKIAESQVSMADLEGSFETTLGKLLALNTANDQLAAERDLYRKEASWLNQVAGYHRGYAGTEREVQISAKEQNNKQMLTKWFAKMMGRNFSVPDLSASGLTFIGGRVFFVNGKPTGQIAYHDGFGRLTGFCFTARPDQPESDPVRGQDGDLNLVSWNKNGIDYVLVGWTAAPDLNWIANGLQQSYGDNI